MASAVFTHIVKELAFYPQLPGGNAAFRVLRIRLCRVERVGDVQSELPLLLFRDKPSLNKILSLYRCLYCSESKC